MQFVHRKLNFPSHSCQIQFDNLILSQLFCTTFFKFRVVMFLRLQPCCRYLNTYLPTAVRSFHNVSHTSSRIKSPLLRNSTIYKSPAIRFTNSQPGPVKVKFRKQDVLRLFRFGKGEGYVILGEHCNGQLSPIRPL